MNALINQLNTQFQMLEQSIKGLKLSSKQWFANSEIFRSSGFSTHSDDIDDYLIELKTTIDKLASVNNEQHVSYLSERVTQQFSCLKRFVKSNDINVRNNQYSKDRIRNLNKTKQFTLQASQSSQELYAELSKLQEFERRLLDKVNLSQQQLTMYKGMSNRPALQQEVLTNQQRLGRCRQALSKVEESIQKLDNNN
ncbi:primosomal replication protein PriC [Psychrosphaera aquimarina]|jgi:primosomal replication protein N''|uniref:Primosomal replication protein PriC n=1 Tax=Psychrosphaera aquimarina TaxID=2044854 RepID=A0ABU3R3D5_9GAMM|nr:primosomal replication protein PriC [Psychrosphaera aquimarina]MDU0114168.1 primosomal replication protein PriC [Psychrosphaera aquimarina]